MLPVLKPLHEAAVGSFVEIIEQDTDGTTLRNLLDVVHAVLRLSPHSDWP